MYVSMGQLAQAAADAAAATTPVAAPAPGLLARLSDSPAARVGLGATALGALGALGWHFYGSKKTRANGRGRRRN